MPTIFSTIFKSVDSNNLANGIYNGFFVVNSNASNGIFSIPITLNAGNIMLGDINQDSQYNVLDIVLLVSFILETTPTLEEAALSDLNADGIINILDVIMLVNIVLSQ